MPSNDENEWQPISTVPRRVKGNRDLLVDLWAVQLDGWGFRIPDCYFHQAQQVWKSKHYSGSGYNRANPKFAVTHWRPVPDPPLDKATLESVVSEHTK